MEKLLIIYVFTTLHSDFFPRSYGCLFTKVFNIYRKKKLSKTNILIEGIDSNTYRRNIYSIIGFTLIQSVLIRPFHFKVNLTIKRSFYMYRSWKKMVDSKQMYSGNQLLLVFTLTSFYHLHVKLVRYTPWTKAAIRRYSSK